MPIQPKPTPRRPQIQPETVTAAGTEVPQLLSELTAEQFGLWRQHPVTQTVLQRFLPHFRGSLQQGVINSWLAGSLSLQVEDEARGYIKSLQMIEDLTLDQMRIFYGVGPAPSPTRPPAAPARSSNRTGY